MLSFLFNQSNLLSDSSVGPYGNNIVLYSLLEAVAELMQVEKFGQLKRTVKSCAYDLKV